MTIGVYVIIAPSGRRYVGSSVNVEKRWSAHRVALRSGAHHCVALQRAANKYGVDSLQFALIETCDRAELLVREQHHIDALSARRRYNSALTAGSLMGYPTTAETRAKQSRAKLGKRKSDETRRRMSAYARARSAAHTARLAAAQTGKSATLATRAKQRAAKVGKPQTEDHVRRVQQALQQVVRKDNKVGVRGVSPVGAKWVARIKVGDKYKHLGTFADLQSAADAVRNARQEMPE